MKFEDIARAMHEFNRIFTQLNGKDDPHPGWDDAPDWQKDIARSAVKFHLDAPNATLKEAHDQWRKDMEKNGWTYGPDQNNVTRTHPGLVSFFQLPRDEQYKQIAFKACVYAFKN